MVTNKDCISFDFADIRGAPLKRGYHAPGTQYSIIPAFQHSIAQVKALPLWEERR